MIPGDGRPSGLPLPKLLQDIVVLSHNHRLLLFYHKYDFWRGPIPIEQMTQYIMTMISMSITDLYNKRCNSHYLHITIYTFIYYFWDDSELSDLQLAHLQIL